MRKITLLLIINCQLSIINSFSQSYSGPESVVYDSANNLISTAPNGEPQLTVLEHPNVVVIPIIDAFVNGSHPVTVVNFAYFVITSWTKTNVRGRFIKTGAPSGRICPSTPGGQQLCPVGAYDPNGISVVTLVG